MGVVLPSVELVDIGSISVAGDFCEEIIHYIGTGRVSVLFRAATRSLDDAMIVALIAPPDDTVKRMKVIEWVQSEPERYHRVSSEVLAKGYQIALDLKPWMQ